MAPLDGVYVGSGPPAERRSPPSARGGAPCRGGSGLAHTGGSPTRARHDGKPAPTAGPRVTGAAKQLGHRHEWEVGRMAAPSTARVGLLEGAAAAPASPQSAEAMRQAQLLTEETYLPDVLRGVRTAVLTLTGDFNCFVRTFLLDPEADELCHYSFDERGEIVDELRVPRGIGLVGLVADERVALHVADAETHIRYERAIDAPADNAADAPPPPAPRTVLGLKCFPLLTSTGALTAATVLDLSSTTKQS